MKRKVLLAMVLLLCSGCIPASQQEVIELTNLVKEIVPVVREVAGEGNEKVERLLSDVERVNEAVATADDPVEAISKGWDASKPFNPYYGYGAAALALLKLFGDNKKKKIIEDKYAATKVGIEKFRNENGDGGVELYKIIGEVRKAKKIV
ncbi:MAG TPA: hypothetical protein ENH74_00490 [Methylophaga sp.]|nr:hypothetical protein [Methylophaga sp.]